MSANVVKPSSRGERHSARSQWLTTPGSLIDQRDLRAIDVSKQVVEQPDLRIRQEWLVEFEERRTTGAPAGAR